MSNSSGTTPWLCPGASPGEVNRAEADQLAVRFKSGDAKAFDRLVLMFQRPVFNLAYRMLNRYEDASDAAQEIFVKLYRSIGKFRGDSSFSTWLFAIAVNVCRSRMRSARSRGAVEVLDADLRPADDDPPPDHQGVDPAATPDRQAERTELMATVKQAIATLPPDFAAVIVMKDIQDVTYEEIAERLGCNMGTVKSRLFRARAMVRDKLSPLMS
ncbi:MAG: sigma-70 family RNA polymerase sigma factor [Verrucomicrobiota bacterium]|nr:sigma-70 family RNA polymerase sigma factor [Verrucomicrobiota bacterium]